MLSISPGASPPASPIDAIWMNEKSRVRRDLTVLDPDVALAAEPHARIQNVPAGDHELVLQRGVARIEPAWHRHRHDVAGGGLGLRLRERGAGRDRSG